MKYPLFFAIIFTVPACKKEQVCDQQPFYGKYECKHYFTGNLYEPPGWPVYKADTLLGVVVMDISPAASCDAILLNGMELTRSTGLAFSIDLSNHYDKSEGWSVQFFEPDSVAISHSIIYGYVSTEAKFDKYRGRKLPE
jgi:hypothetical protein